MDALNAQSLLVVDDDEVFCAALGRALTRRGFAVHQAHDVAQALQRAAAQRPGCAVIDLRLGDESGLVLVEQLIQQLPGIRIVVLTGYASIVTAVEAIKLGAVHYLTKPAQADDIVTALRKDDGNADADLSTKPMSVQRLEWEHIQSVLARCNGNVSAAARALGMHRRSLQRKLQKRPVRR